MARICTIRQRTWPFDPRAAKEVAALCEAGHEVDVICMRRRGELRVERFGSVTVHRVPPERGASTPRRRAWEYALFLGGAMTLAARLHLRRRFDVVQANSTPDHAVFAALVPRLLGARVLLDLQEPMPEFCATKLQVGASHPVVRLVAVLEQASIRFADHTITCTDAMRAAYISRGADPKRISLVLNGSDETIFDPDRFPPKPRSAEEFVLICHGSVEKHYGIDTVIRAVARAREVVPNLRLDVYGTGSEVAALKQLSESLSLNGAVRFSQGFVPIDELVQAIADADVGVVAMKRDPFRDLTLCSKMYDFICMHKPVIASRTACLQSYYGSDSFLLFESGDDAELARGIAELHGNVTLRQALVARAGAANEQHRWLHQREVYLKTIDGLVSRRRPKRRRVAVGRRDPVAP